MAKNIIISEGCTSFYTKVDDRFLDEIDQEEYNNLVDYLLEKVKIHINERTILIDDLIKLFQYKHIEYDEDICDQCGDDVVRTYFEI